MDRGRKNVIQQDPVILWGWIRSEDRLMLNWQLNEPSVTINDICKTCTCSIKYRSCKCGEGNMKCLTFCGSKNKCEKSFV